MAQSAVVRWANPAKILVATNLLEGQTLILHAIDQAMLSRASVLLVHVIGPSSLRVDSPMDTACVVPSFTLQSVKAKLDEAAREFQRAGILCESVVLGGLPTTQISLLVRSRDIDRVIVGKRYASGVARLVEESVAEELIETLDIPVCTIGRRAHPAAACGVPMGRVLLASSLHSSCSRVALFASTLAESNRAHLVLLHALNTAGMSAQRRETERFTASQRLASLVPPEARHKYGPEFKVREGDPAAVILEEAGSLPHDMLILGSPNASKLSELLANGVVRRVIVDAQCPVITFKASPALYDEKAHESDQAALFQPECR